MSRCSLRISLLFAFLFSSEVWAIGLGDINLDSALNEPLRADIVLLAATPEEIASLKVALASVEDFARYGIDRPAYLQSIDFDVVNGGVNGSVVRLRSRSPITEPFLTFLVEATWPSGRLLREYTVLLDPPTYTPPGVQQAPVVQAPVRARPTDSAPIERRPAPSQPVQRQAEPEPAPTPRPAPRPRPAVSAQDSTPREPAQNVDFSTDGGGDVYVANGDTLWGIASRMRPDSRLSMNQTMVAIYEANRHAFDNNINRLRAGSTLRIPSADEVFQISRGDAFNEVRRQNNDWDSGTVVDSDFDAPADTAPSPSLVLVPPDEEPDSTVFDDDVSAYEPYSREQEIEDRIAELEAADVPNQQSLIEIRDNELAALRQELAELRGEVYEPPVDDIADDVADDMVDDVTDDAADDVLDTDQIFVDDTVVDDAADDVAADDAADVDEEPAVAPPSDIVTTERDADEGIVGTILGYLTNVYVIIGAAILLVLGLLVAFMRRGGDDDDIERPWEALDSGDSEQTTFTETMQAPTREEAIVVVEQDSGIHRIADEDDEGGDTIITPIADVADDAEDTAEVDAADPVAETTSGEFGSLEDTFSSETAVNLDQTDPIAEADFHMAYGLYDQAADLINGALETDPDDANLMSKLCEIYFVWGNRDAFVDAASRLKSAVGDDNAEWNKTVIMGQQIAADHAMFAGAAVAGATKAVDLSFDDAGDDTGALDMDFGADDGGADDVVDLGADSGDDSGIDFSFDEGEDDLEDTAETPTIEEPIEVEVTAEMPTPTVETPTIEQQFDGMGEGTTELPSLDEEGLGQAVAGGGIDSDATAEINVDELDLDLDIDSNAATELASLDDLDDTGVNEPIDEASETGKNPEIDPTATGVREALDVGATGIGEALDIDDLVDTGTSATGLHLAADETGQSPSPKDPDEETSVDIDDSLLDATGMTQVLTEDMAVETGTVEALPDDAETMLASLDDDDDDDDFDFAKTEALPQDAFSGDGDETTEAPAVAETDVDLDLDDLTAALQVSDIGDTVEQPRDDATVEQPRPDMASDETAEIPTMALGPDEMSDDLDEARTMTEVGTKLDLARAYVDMGDPTGARSILEEVLEEGDEAQRQQAQQLLDSLPS